MPGPISSNAIGAILSPGRRAFVSFPSGPFRDWPSSRQTIISLIQLTPRPGSSARKMYEMECSQPVSSENSPLSDFSISALLMAAATVFYCLVAAHTGLLNGPSVTNYFLRLADAFNHGSLALLPSTTEATLDLVSFKGQLFLYWAPLPAVLLMPLVYLFGTAIPDAWIVAFVGGLNVGLSYLLARSRWNGRVLSQLRASALAITFALGSVHMPLASSNGVWATSQIFSYFFLALGVLFALRSTSSRGYFVAGVFAGFACLCRLSMMGAVIGLGCLIALRDDPQPGRVRARHLVAFGMPLLGSAGLYSLYNLARFGALFETGYMFHLCSPRFTADVSHYGLISLHYLWINFWYHYLAPPYLFGRDDFLEGASLFLMTPVFFAAFQTLLPSVFDRRVAALWVGMFLAALPSLVLFGTGWIQVGPRYTLDYTPLLLVLVASGIQRWPRPMLYSAAAFSMVNYLLARSLQPGN